MSEIQQARDAIKKIQGYVEGQYVVLSKPGMTAWLAIACGIGAVLGFIVGRML